MTPPSATPADLTFEAVAWDDPRAVAIRRRMDDEIMPRYSLPGEVVISDGATEALRVDPADIVTTVLVLDPAGAAIAHGALRMLRGEWEVKRVVVVGDQRGRGVGRALMTELERVARAAGAPRLILQTGDRQPEAVALYVGLGYTRIPIYEPYATAIPFSLCFEKPLPAD